MISRTNLARISVPFSLLVLTVFLQAVERIEGEAVSNGIGRYKQDFTYGWPLPLLARTKHTEFDHKSRRVPPAIIATYNSTGIFSQNLCVFALLQAVTMASSFYVMTLFLENGKSLQYDVMTGITLISAVAITLAWLRAGTEDSGRVQFFWLRCLVVSLTVFVVADAARLALTRGLKPRNEKNNEVLHC